MGTKIDSKSYLPGYNSMRDLNEDSSSSSSPLCYGDKVITNGQYYNGFMPRTAMDGYPGYGKDALKQKMLEHDSVFKNQVYELHRLYRIQRDMTEEFRTKDLGIRPSMEPSSSSSSLRGPQVPLEEARKWHMPGFPLFNSTYEMTSISGVEIAYSPMSSTKEKNAQPGQLPFLNWSSVKDSELLDSRLLKVRKKLFDLELPADEYIDSEEGKESPDCKGSHVSSYAPNGNVKSGPETQNTSAVGHIGANINCRIDVSASTSYLRNSMKFVDLNEPIDVEEATAPLSSNFLGHSSINGQSNNGVDLRTKSSAGFLGANAKTAHYGDGILTNSSIESKVNERGYLSHFYEAGSSKSNLDSITHGLQHNKSHPGQCMPDPRSHTPGVYLSQHIRENQWRERNHHHLESSDRSHDKSNNRLLGPHIASHSPGPDAFFSPSYFSGTWAHPASSYAKPAKSFTQKVTALDSCLNSGSTMGRGLQIKTESRENFGGTWRVGDDFRSNPGLGGDLSGQNKFYHGSASGSKELKSHLPSSGFDFLDCNRGENVASDRTTNHGCGNFPKVPSFADSKPAIDINLNEVVSKSSSNEVIILQDAAILDEVGKPEIHPSALPWLRNKPSRANLASSNQLCCNNEKVGDLNEPFTPKNMWDSSDRKTEITRKLNAKKIMGFPIFDQPFSHVSTSASFSCPRDGNSVDKERKKRVIDINLEYEPEDQVAAAEKQTVEKEKQTKCRSVRDYIDLNSCITDSEDTLAPSYESKTVIRKVVLDIDLESPIIPETEEDEKTASKENNTGEVSLLSPENKSDSSEDEVLRIAAEAIIEISSFCPKIQIEESNIDLLEASLAESFVWFVNVVSSLPDELKTASEDLAEEIDEFEAMTLQIPETREEDYMPKPFIPEVQKTEEVGANTVTRPRRGQSRRGRQRRDFQRDILPGLTSLSRHEVTEDIQTFGGMMRATGHHWVSGLARRNGARNGGGRGRRRAVVENVTTVPPSPVCNPPLIQQLNSIEAGLEAWGKTPRRPRRQRCPAGNHPTAVVLT